MNVKQLAKSLSAAGKKSKKFEIRSDIVVRTHIDENRSILAIQLPEGGWFVQFFNKGVITELSMTREAAVKIQKLFNTHMPDGMK